MVPASEKGNNRYFYLSLFFVGSFKGPYLNLNVIFLVYTAITDIKMVVTTIIKSGKFSYNGGKNKVKARTISSIIDLY